MYTYLQLHTYIQKPLTHPLQTFNGEGFAKSISGMFKVPNFRNASDPADGSSYDSKSCVR